MTRELDNLVAARQLKAEPGSPQEVATLQQRAASLLVDFENLQPSASEVTLVRGDEYRLWVFRGPHQNKFAAELVEAWQPLGDKVHFVRSFKTGKNALDFHIAFSLGLLSEETRAAGRAARYVVVSVDGGFEPLFDHMRKGFQCAVGKASSIPEALALADTLTASLPDAASSQAHRTEPAQVVNAPHPSPPTPSPAKKAAKKESDCTFPQRTGGR